MGVWLHLGSIRVFSLTVWSQVSWRHDEHSNETPGSVLSAVEVIWSRNCGWHTGRTCLVLSWTARSRPQSGCLSSHTFVLGWRRVFLWVGGEWACGLGGWCCSQSVHRWGVASRERMCCSVTCMWVSLHATASASSSTPGHTSCEVH